MPCALSNAARLIGGQLMAADFVLEHVVESCAVMRRY
jgi:hypothetical protein